MIAEFHLEHEARMHLPFIDGLQGFRVRWVVVAQEWAVLHAESITPEREVSNCTEFIGILRIWRSIWVGNELTFNIFAAQGVSSTSESTSF